MRNILIVLLFPVILFACSSEQVPLRTRLATHLWQQFNNEVDIGKLIKGKGKYLRQKHANFDPDNNCFYLEFSADCKEEGQYLAMLSFSEKDLIRLRIFPPENLYLPYYSGFIKRSKGRIIFRGCVSDYSEHIRGCFKPVMPKPGIL